MSTVLIISLAAGVVLIVGGGLMMYLANLVKSAYEIKVQINADVEERLTKMGEDLDKKSRWIKRDLIEEIEKIKVAIQTDNVRKLEELTAALVQRVEGWETLLRNDHGDWVKAIEADRSSIASLDTRMKNLTKLVKKGDEPAQPLELSQVTDSSGDAAATAQTEAEAPPTRPTGPTPVGEFLQELNQARR